MLNTDVALELDVGRLDPKAFAEQVLKMRAPLIVMEVLIDGFPAAFAVLRKGLLEHHTLHDTSDVRCSQVAVGEPAPR